MSYKQQNRYQNNAYFLFQRKTLCILQSLVALLLTTLFLVWLASVLYKLITFYVAILNLAFRFHNLILKPYNLVRSVGVVGFIIKFFLPGKVVSPSL